MSKQVDDSFIINGEMGRRMVAMIDRDNTLKEIISKKIAKDDYKRIIDDMDYISSVCQAGRIYAKAKEAGYKLDKAANDQLAEPLTEDQKLELATDILMLNVVNNAKDAFAKTTDNIIATKTKYKNMVKEINDKDVDETDKALEIENKADRDKAFDDITFNRNVRMANVRDFISDDKLVRSLTSDNATAALRESVRELAKDGGFNRLSPAEIVAKMNDKKIVQKLATLTANANEKSVEENAKKAAKQNLEKARATEAKRKRDARLGRNH